MTEIIKFIHKQFAFNRNKNLYYSHLNSSMSLVPEISSVLVRIRMLTIEEEKKIIDYTSKKALEEFYRINQYYSFSENDKMELEKIYSQLFQLLKQTSADNINRLSQISEKHNSTLKKWLLRTNFFSSKIYNESDEFAPTVTCAEYTANLQLKILNISLSDCQSPILDIGCGKRAHLVNFFREHGIEAFGIDRFESEYQFCEQADWLKFDYGKNKWGTIISHLGFSNHFTHHHLRIDGNFREYANAYMNILKSLKQDGFFAYTPSLPFIEKYLDNTIYKVNKSETKTTNFKSSKVIFLN